MALGTIKTFYVPSGSVDLPNNYGWDKPFGHNEESNGDITGPIYNYSLMDVIKNFSKPSILLRECPTSTGAAPLNSILIAETENNEDVTKQNINNPEWTKIYRIIHAIYINQSNWDNQPNDITLYKSLGDEKLSTDVDVKDIYVSGSLEIFKDLNSNNRFYKANIRVKIENISTLIEIYFYPDYFIKYGATKSYDVYTYEDTDGNNIISEQEMELEVVAKFFNTVKNGRYKRYDKFKTARRIGNYETSNGSTVGYPVEEQVFFVLSSLAPEPISNVSENDKIRAVRNYLISMYPNSTEKLIWMYPDLFNNSSVTIIPVYDNFLSGSGNVNTVKHPFDGYKLIQTLNSNNIPTDPSSVGGYPYEIFYVGYLSSNSYSFLYPLIAVEDKTLSEERYPISSRFPQYKPIFGQSAATPTDESSKFHQFILTSLNIIAGHMTVDEIDSTWGSMDWKADPAEGNKPSQVSFTFLGTRWLVKGTV